MNQSAAIRKAQGAPSLFTADLDALELGQLLIVPSLTVQMHTQVRNCAYKHAMYWRRRYRVWFAAGITFVLRVTHEQWDQMRREELAKQLRIAKGKGRGQWAK